MYVRLWITRNSLLAAFTVLSVPLAHSQSEVTEADTVVVTLESAILRALEVSPEVGAVAAGRNQAIARWRFARSLRFLSEFEATSAHSFSPGLKNIEGLPTGELYLNPSVRNDRDNLSPFSVVEIKAVQPIYTWGELSGNIKAAEHGVAVEEGSVDLKMLEVASRTAEIYYGLLLADALSRLTDDANDAVSKAIEEIENQMDEGDPGVDDADLFQVQIAEQEVARRVVEVGQKLRTMQSALTRQMFLPEGTVPDLGARRLGVVPFELEALPFYESYALEHRPELGQADAGMAARNAQVGVARSDYFPKLFLAVRSKYSYATGRYRQRNPYVSDPFLSRGVQAGFGFRQKLNFLQTKAKVEQAKSDLDTIRFQKQAARQLVLFEVEEAYRNVLIARSAVETRGKALTISKEWLRSEEINFDLEFGDTENLVRAVRANLELQAANLEAVHSYNISVIRLLKATGTLTQIIQSGTFVE
ncbi:MAG: TolC family protein [Rhodothermia bacterium]|nr:MAG: TolC family protein [Rhodothermia bacterium]